MADTIHTRIARLLHETGKKQKDLASYCGVSPQAVNQWLGRSKDKKPITPELKYVSLIAEFFETTVDYLLNGNGGIHEAKNSIIGVDRKKGVDVPLLSLDELMQINPETFSENKHPRGIKVQTQHRVSPRAVAFALQDNSMEPRFYEADIIVIDPELAYEPGDFVAAHIKSLGITVFRQFAYDGADHRVLAAINPQHRTFRFTHGQWDEDVQIIGTWVERTTVNPKSQKRHTS
jgi:SOS-response transcriptional repressor LexA